jgi:hypothetical protein
MPAIAQSISRFEAEQRSQRFARYKELLARQHGLKESELRELVGLATALGRNATADAAVVNQADMMRAASERDDDGPNVIEARRQLQEADARMQAAFKKAQEEHRPYVIAEQQATAKARQRREAVQRWEEFKREHTDLLAG